MPPLVADPQWLDAQYDALRGIDAAKVFGAWRNSSDESLSAPGWQLDLRYGRSDGETLDWLPAANDQPLRGVLLFFHGGFWRGSDKSLHRFIAPAFARAGVHVVLANYSLCPAVTISTIVQQAAAARDWVQAQRDRWGVAGQPLVVSGHSAGGHLAAMLSSQAWAGDQAVGPTLSLSGLHDLAPLVNAPFVRNDLRLSPEMAHAMSPVCQRPAPGTKLALLVGAKESNEFRRQSWMLHEAWGPTAVHCCDEVPGATHFDLVEALASPASSVHACAMSLFD